LSDVIKSQKKMSLG